jgi:hypothetical protein
MFLHIMVEHNPSNIIKKKLDLFFNVYIMMHRNIFI